MTVIFGSETGPYLSIPCFLKHRTTIRKGHSREFCSLGPLMVIILLNPNHAKIVMNDSLNLYVQKSVSSTITLQRYCLNYTRLTKLGHSLASRQLA